MDARRVRVEIAGLVQGVGFRPFVYRLAVEQRLGGTIASSILAAAEGADVLLVHDVAEMAQAARVASAILG